MKLTRLTKRLKMPQSMFKERKEENNHHQHHYFHKLLKFNQYHI